MRRFWQMGAVALAMLIVSGHAQGEPASTVRTVGVARKSNQLVASVGLQDLFGSRDVERLLSGFSTRVLIRVALLRDGISEPVATATRLSEVVYDLWDEKLRVRLSTGKASTSQTLVVPTAKAAVDAATTLTDFALADAETLDARFSYHLSVRADLNPISDELVTNVRRWLSHPSGHGRTGSADSFFGSFVSVFVNPRIDDSERMLQVTSQSFSLPGSKSP
jgi:hypothetical protein